MVFGGGGPPPPINTDPKAVRAAAERNHRNSVGLTQDLAIISGWIWKAITWPIRLILRVVRRNKDDDDPNSLD